MNVFVPLWSPPEGVYAGGFYRAKRMLESFFDVKPYVARNESFEITTTHTRTYRARLFSRHPGFFQFARLLNWIWSGLAISYMGLTWREKFDAVYVPVSEILPMTVAGWLVARVRGIPLVLCNLNVRDTEFWLINRWFHRCAESIITLSTALADELRAEGLTVPMRIGTVGVDDLHVDAYGKTEFDAIYVGRHTDAKGIFELLDIWERVMRLKPTAQLLTIGSIGPKTAKRIACLLKERRLSNNITMLGTVPEKTKWDSYARANLCVFPSLVEGWGIVPIEAHLAGLPVVAYNLPAYAETIALSSATRCIRVGDRQTFAETIVEWVAHPPDISPARAWARHFTWSSAAHREEDLLEEILGS